MKQPANLFLFSVFSFFSSIIYLYTFLIFSKDLMVIIQNLDCKCMKKLAKMDGKFLFVPVSLFLGVIQGEKSNIWCQDLTPGYGVYWFLISRICRRCLKSINFGIWCHHMTPIDCGKILRRFSKVVTYVT